MHQPYVITIILNTNRRDDTLDCLTSLAQNTYQNHKVIVLDNASSDGSVEAISLKFPAVEIISLTENRGYAGNNNVGIEAAMAQQADWVFVLNEDTILDPECIAHLIEVGESDPKVGIVGPLVYHYDEPNVLQSAGGHLSRYWEGSHIGQNEVDSGQFNQPRKVDWISGCAILVRREVIEQVGMLDERFFYYWEETEWCLRTNRSGWRIVHVPQAKLWHKGVQRDYRPKPSVTYYSTRNRFLMLAKHHAPLTTWLVAWLQILRILVSWTIKPKWRPMHQHRNAMWRGIVDFLRHRWGPMPS
ncbi:MAG TPA: glycosyltransferase family 2 protein, partial [Anaerolineae bacterium]|nr:glycosyltransferase family 2 protein [Anaerolineae bacterium]